MRSSTRGGWRLWLGALALAVVGAGLAWAPRPAMARDDATGLANARQGSRDVQVYFSKRPESDENLSAVFPVSRSSPDLGVATAALRALIAGPTPDEIAEGYFSELGQMLVGPSTCGADFTVRVEHGLATVQFCRLVSSAGIGQDARVMSALESTLRQFSTVQRVRVLTREGDCLFDMSGENRCLTTL